MTDIRKIEVEKREIDDIAMSESTYSPTGIMLLKVIDKVNEIIEELNSRGQM